MLWEKIKNKLRNIWDGSNQPPEEKQNFGEKPGEGNTPPVPEKLSEKERAKRLFGRLTKEYASESNYKRIRRAELNTSFNEKQLANQIIALMFKLSLNPGNGYTSDETALIKQLDFQTLSSPLKIFYIYIPEAKREILEVTTIADTVYSRLFELAESSKNLKDFIEKCCKDYIEALPNNMATEQTYGTDAFKEQFRSAFMCRFCVYVKMFSDTRYCFILGKNPIYDMNEVRLKNLLLKKEKEEQERTDRIDGTNKAEVMPEEVLAAVKVSVSFNVQNENRYVFNAHRFEKQNPLPQREGVLYLSSLRNSWEFSAGTADHDEVSCSNNYLEPVVMRVDALQIDEGRFRKFEIKNSLPDIEVSQIPTITRSLIKVIGVTRFRPELRLDGRLLPKSHEGQKSELNDLAETNLKNVLNGLQINSAIKISNTIWLFYINEHVQIAHKTGGTWQITDVPEKVEFTINSVVYFWSPFKEENKDSELSDYFWGVLYLKPQNDSEKSNYKVFLSANVEDEPLAISTNGLDIKNSADDSLLGTYGIIGLKCESEDEGKISYSFVPVTNPKSPQHPFFAIQPAAPNSYWVDGAGKWLRYNPDNESDGELIFSEQEKCLIYDSKKLLATRSSFRMIFGTSFFNFKVSPTPAVKRVNWDEDDTIRIAPDKDISSPRALPSATTDFITVDDVPALLGGTNYAGFIAEEIGTSNIALHFKLNKPGEISHFLKIYRPGFEDSATRETDFYNRYGTKAYDLLIQNPDILRSGSKSPFGLVFRFLRDYEDFFGNGKIPSLAQATAIGYAAAKLNRHLEENGFINYDIDMSSFCFDEDGRLYISDFDNFFPIYTGQIQPAVLAIFRSLLASENFPARNPNPPPEVRKFDNAKPGEEKRQALKSITGKYVVFMIAIAILEMLKKIKLGDDKSPVVNEGVLSDGSVEDEKQNAVDLEKLLRSMLAVEPSMRPSLVAVEGRLKQILAAMIGDDTQAHADVITLLGNIPE